MGCNWSTNNDSPQNNKSNFVQHPKAPILLFYLPGNVRDVLTKLVSQFMMGSETTQPAGRLNIRFIDIPNQRSNRRYWPKEFTNKPDHALSLYLADIRERSSLLLNVKSLNWFLKQMNSKGDIRIIAISSSDRQITEFKNLLSAPNLEILPLNESKPETVFQFVELVTNAVSRYNETRSRLNEVSTRHQRHVI